MASALGFLLAAAPFASAQAKENINIYGWQNWSYEWISADGGRDYDRMSNNAANIGFMSHMDTGYPGLQVGFRCEQFTLWGRLNNYTGWCNRNSKISLRHDTMGEIMFGQWLLPYNEIVAQWVDPFYDAGADSHTSIMGNLGGTASKIPGNIADMYYNGSFNEPDDFGPTLGVLSFNRRQEGIIQYVWPNTSAMADQSRDGFQFRFAMTQGSNTDRDVAYGGAANDNAVGSYNHDPRIFSTGVSYQHNMGADQIWLAVAYEKHEDWSANALAAEALCSDSDDEGFRVAGRYKKDWGNGQSTWLAAMWENLEYDADDCLIPATDTTRAGGTNGTMFDSPVWSDVEQDAWMISGKHTFGNGLDFRFSYMDADEWDCGGDACTAAEENDTDAEAINLGLFYTLPKGTEFRLTYSEIKNEDNAQHDFLFNTDAVTGENIEMVAVGIVHWFD